MAKYTYETLKAQLSMLASNGETSIEKLRVFYPRAGWTELISAVRALAENDNTVTYNPKNHNIKVGQ
jgi:hypothetical protein